jgi:serine/threonine protein kinase
MTGGAAPPAQGAHARGDVVADRYEIRSVVGERPLGMLYRALDREVGVEVALRVLRPSLFASAVERRAFVEQLGKGRVLAHRSLVRLYDVRLCPGAEPAPGDPEERVVIAVQWAPGPTLAEKVRLGPLAAEEARGIVRQIAAGVVHAHQFGVVLGDLRTETVILLADGLKLSNVGVARAMPRAAYLEAMKPTPGFLRLPPELRAGKVIDARADVYALAAITVELLTGAVPSRPLEIPGAAPPLVALLRRALANDAFVRPTSAEAFASELDQLLGGVTPGERRRRPSIPQAFIGPETDPEALSGRLAGPTASTTEHEEPTRQVDEGELKQLQARADDTRRATEEELFPLRLQAAGALATDEDELKLEVARAYDEVANTPRAATGDGDEAEEGSATEPVFLLEPEMAHTAPVPRVDAPPPAPSPPSSSAPPPGPPSPSPPTVTTEDDLDLVEADALEELAGVEEPPAFVAPDALASPVDAPAPPPPSPSPPPRRVEDASETATPLPPPRPSDDKFEEADFGDDSLETNRVEKIPPEKLRDLVAPSAARAIELHPSAPRPEPAALPPPPAPPASTVAPAEPPPQPERRRRPSTTDVVPLPRRLPTRAPGPRWPLVVALAAAAIVVAAGTVLAIRFLLRPPPPSPTTVEPSVVATPSPPAPQLPPTPQPPSTTPPPPAPSPSKPIVTHPDVPSPSPAPAAPGGCPLGTGLVPSTPAVCIDLYEYPGGNTIPRVSVGFDEADAICKSRGARLCSDAEWERACRGKNGASYPYGASFDPTRCNTQGNSGEPAPAGTFASCRSAVGAYDMSGNVAEWVTSKGAPALKGGSAVDANPLVRCSNTVRNPPPQGGPTIGFRCCAPAP